MIVKPYPWKCHTCRQRAVEPVVVDYETDMEHDGQPYHVTVSNLELLECNACHTRSLPDEALLRITEALRKQANLLTARQIAQQRTNLGLTQKELAKRLAIAEATLARWEDGGQIQQRPFDRLLRAFFAFGDVRAAFADEDRLRQLMPAE